MNAVGRYPDRRSLPRDAAHSKESPRYCTDAPGQPQLLLLPRIRSGGRGSANPARHRRTGGYVLTALVALTMEDAEDICDELNRRLGLDREAWTVMAAGSMRSEEDEPGDGPGTERHTPEPGNVR